MGVSSSPRAASCQSGPSPKGGSNGRGSERGLTMQIQAHTGKNVSPSATVNKKGAGGKSHISD